MVEILSRRQVEDSFSNLYLAIPHPKITAVLEQSVQVLREILNWPTTAQNIRDQVTKITGEEISDSTFNSLVDSVKSTKNKTSISRSINHLGPESALLFYILASVKQDLTQKIPSTGVSLPYGDVVAKTVAILGPSHRLLGNLTKRVIGDFSRLKPYDSLDNVKNRLESIQSTDQSLHRFLQSTLNAIPLNDPLTLNESTAIIIRAFEANNMLVSRETVSSLVSANPDVVELGNSITVDHQRFILFDPDGLLALGALVFIRQNDSAYNSKRGLFTKLAGDLFGREHSWYRLLTTKKENETTTRLAGLIDIKDLGSLQDVLYQLEQSDPQNPVSVSDLRKMGVQTDPKILAAGLSIISQIYEIVKEKPDGQFNNQIAYRLVHKIYEACCLAQNQHHLIPSGSLVQALKDTRRRYGIE
jgi:hypothetical protein